MNRPLPTHRAGEFADDYAGSALKKENDEALERHSKQRSMISGEMQKELQVRRATVTPFWWAVKTLVKVGPPSCHPGACLLRAFNFHFLAL